jgi:hypothetical protein
MQVKLEWSIEWGAKKFEVTISCGPLKYAIEQFFTRIITEPNRITLMGVNNYVDFELCGTVCEITLGCNDCWDCSANIECPENTFTVPLQDVEALIEELRVLADAD